MYFFEQQGKPHTCLHYSAKCYSIDPYSGYRLSYIKIGTLKATN